MKIIEIKDYYGKIQAVPVSDELYEEWLEMSREEDRLRKLESYHRDYSDPESYDVTMRITDMDTVMDALIQEEENQRLYNAIAKLGPTQRRRVLMYMDCMSYTEVAKQEGITVTSLYQNLSGAFKRLRKFLSE